MEAVQLLTRYVFSLEDERSADTPLKPAQLSGFHWLPAIPQPPAAPALVGSLDIPHHFSGSPAELFSCDYPEHSWQRVRQSAGT